MPSAKIETPEILEIYKVYLSLGPNRDCQKVADQVGRNVRTIQHYRKQFNWEQRVQEHLKTYGSYDLPSAPASGEKKITSSSDVTKGVIEPAEIPSAMESFTGPIPRSHSLDAQRTPEQIITKYSIAAGMGEMSKEEYRLLLGYMVRDFARRFMDGEVQINSIYEFERCVKLDLLLMGEATKKVALDAQGMVINNTEYNVKIEQSIQNNPTVQNLMKELWRDYQGGTVDLKKGIGNIHEAIAEDNSERVISIDELNEMARTEI